MLYKGKATCKEHGEFEWQIVEGEEKSFVIGKDLLTKYVKHYDKNIGLVIASCPQCGARIEISFEFNKC